ncbi:hypothetical protein CMO88_02475 [Candidatus Woesearchaeota archaeon]|nr:hypothetical protein [Candidatus Woesearchaeota archaeon]|tara:strand:- start:6635 stop:7165 length:531 start_codon:yes stop_codon:yes gene_type:complete
MGYVDDVVDRILECDKIPVTNGQNANTNRMIKLTGRVVDYNYKYDVENDPEGDDLINKWANGQTVTLTITLVSDGYEPKTSTITYVGFNEAKKPYLEIQKLLRQVMQDQTSLEFVIGKRVAKGNNVVVMLRPEHGTPEYRANNTHLKMSGSNQIVRPLRESVIDTYVRTQMQEVSE